MELRKATEKMSISKVIVGIVLSIVVLIIAQNLALNLCEIPLIMGIPAPICNILAGLLYVAFAYIGVKLLCSRFFKFPMDEMRIPKFKIQIVYLFTGSLMPILVLLISILFGGTWQVSAFDSENIFAIVISAIFFYGLAAGIVEEMVFRGIIMGCLERKFGIMAAILIPSLLFGAVHIIGNSLDLISIIQLLVGGSIVGILFSLIAYESGSVWNSAIVHGIWNMAIIGGILHIGCNEDNSSMYNFVLNNKSFLLSGGDFGIEASVISIGVYLIFCIAVICRLKKKGK